MTEKRFIVEKYSIRDRSVDTKYINSYYHIGDNGVAKRLCDLLNVLYEENQNLHDTLQDVIIKQVRYMAYKRNNEEQVKKFLKKQLDYYTERALLLKEPCGDVTEAIHDIARELGIDLIND